MKSAPKDKPLLRLAGLFHDIGKPGTKEVCIREVPHEHPYPKQKDSSQRYHNPIKSTKQVRDYSFHRHEIVGAEMSESIMRDLKFSENDIDYVKELVRHHMWRFYDDTNLKTIKKWYSKVRKIFDDLITLREADRLGNLAKKGRPQRTRKMKELIATVCKIRNEKQPIIVKDLAIDGHRLIQLGHMPGPIFRVILEECLDQILEDPARNTLEYLENFISSKDWEDKRREYTNVPESVHEPKDTVSA